MKFGAARFNTARFNAYNFYIGQSVSELEKRTLLISEGFFDPPIYDGSTLLSISNYLFSSGEVESPVYEGLSNLSIINFNLNSEGIIDYSTIIFDGQSELSVAGLNLISDGDFYIPVYSGVSDLLTSNFSLDAYGDIDYSSIIFNGQSQISLPLYLDLISSGIFEQPTYEGSALLNIDRLISGRGSHVSVIADANIITRGFGINPKIIFKGYQSIDAIFVGSSLLNKSSQLLSNGFVSPPIYDGFCTLTLCSPANLQTYSISYVPVYDGAADLTKLVSFDLNDGYIIHYLSSLGLSVKQAVLVSEGLFSLPVYDGSASLNIIPVSIFNGVNIVKGFVYNQTFYITNKTTKNMYMKFSEKSSRYIVTKWGD